MTNEQNDGQPENDEGSSAALPAQKSSRVVQVTQLDSPPPSGNRAIHPRRPAPIVPTRQERTGEKSGAETES